jgi:hypothetical protein
VGEVNGPKVGVGVAAVLQASTAKEKRLTRSRAIRAII